MSSMAAFVRKTSPEFVRLCFEAENVEGPSPLHWDLPDAHLPGELLKAVRRLPYEGRGRLTVAAERIMSLADQAGQAALTYALGSLVIPPSIEGGSNRATWVFVNDRQAFKRAEEIRFNDGKRSTRMWTAFAIRRGLRIKTDSVSLTAFKSSIRQHYETRHVELDVFARTRTTRGGHHADLMQVAVYLEGQPDAELNFHDDGTLARTVRRPVLEATLTYEPATGSIEVVAATRRNRDCLAHCLARDLLGAEVSGPALPVRAFDLSVLALPQTFPTDPKDHIHGVEVRELRFSPLGNFKKRVDISALEGSQESIWSMADDHVAPAALRQCAWVVLKAKLVIYFGVPSRSGRHKAFELKLRSPHGCNIKDLTAEERLISEKYLRLWGLLKDEELFDAAA